jgi:hypothetical protein
LIERSRTWRADKTPDPATAPEVLRFVRWVADGAEVSAASSL